jgi:hypothetical protein
MPSSVFVQWRDNRPILLTRPATEGVDASEFDPKPQNHDQGDQAYTEHTKPHAIALLHLRFAEKASTAHIAVCTPDSSDQLDEMKEHASIWQTDGIYPATITTDFCNISR